jgi:hypothetical protein
VLGLALAPPELAVSVELELSVPDVDRSAATCACVLVAVAVCRVVIAVWTFVELQTRPVGCALRIWLIVESIFEPDPIGPGG